MDDEKRQIADDPTDSVEQVKKAIDRNGSGRWGVWTFGIVATLLVLFGGLAIMVQNDPAPSPELPGEGTGVDFRQDADPLPDLGTLRDAVRQVEVPLEKSDWSETAQAARQLRTTWNAFRPRMQAQGGVESWDAWDTHDFDDRVQQLVRLVEEEDRQRAQEQVDALFRVIEKYDSEPYRIDEVPGDRRPIPPGTS